MFYIENCTFVCMVVLGRVGGSGADLERKTKRPGAVGWGQKNGYPASLEAHCHALIPTPTRLRLQASVTVERLSDVEWRVVIRKMVWWVSRSFPSALWPAVDAADTAAGSATFCNNNLLGKKE